MPEIEYRIESADTDRREFHIAIHFTPRKENYPITLRMPAWTPGSYLLREYAGSISDIEAYQGETPLNVIKSDKATFVLANTSGDRTPVTIRYALTAVDPSVRKTWISTDRAFISGAAAFLQISGEENTPCRIAVSPAPWDKVSTALPQIIHDGEPFLFSAKDYDHLIDCPILLSRDSDTLSTEFSVHGAVHRLVIDGCPEADAARLTEDLKKICATTIELWEPETKKPPFSDYLFLLTVSGRWGGLEHRNSVAAEAPFSALPMTGAEAPDRYTDLLALMAHEYFHAWNVKRLKPATFLPYDLTKENYTRLLWFFEGFTEYYEEIILFRAGLASEKKILDRLSAMALTVYGQSGWKHQSVAASSFDTWIKYYRPDAGSASHGVSYYQGGAMLAFALDLHIRNVTENRITLDDVMRKIWNLRTDECLGLSEDAVELSDAISEIVDRPAVAVAQWLRRFTRVAGEAPDWDSILSLQGLEMKSEPYDLVRDGLGLRFTASDGFPTVSSVTAGLPASRAGILPGDQLIALDAFRISKATLPELFRQLGTGSAHKLTLFRTDRMMTVDISPLETASPKARFERKTPMEHSWPSAGLSQTH